MNFVLALVIVHAGHVYDLQTWENPTQADVAECLDMTTYNKGTRCEITELTDR